MAKFGLDEIRSAAEAKYGSLDIEMGEHAVSLVNPLRMQRSKREELMSWQDALEDEAFDLDQEEVLSNIILLAASRESDGIRLLQEIDGDLSVMAEIFARYSKVTQAGEASASDD